MNKFLKELKFFIQDLCKSEGHYSPNKILGILASIVLLVLCCYVVFSHHKFSEAVLFTVFSTLLAFIATMFGLRTINFYNVLKSKKNEIQS